MSANGEHVGFLKRLANAASAFSDTWRGGPKVETRDDPAAYVMSADVRQYGEFGKPGPPGEQRDSDYYGISADVLAAITLLSDNASDVVYGVTVDGERVDDHPLAQLLRNPNPSIGGRYFWRRAWSLYYLTGEVFIVGVRTNRVEALVGGAQHLNELWAVSGAWMKAVADNEYLSSWILSRPGYSDLDINFPIEDVCDLTTFNPEDPHRGVSPLMALRPTVEMELSAERANRNLFDNGMMSKGVFVVPNGYDAQTREVLRQALSEFQGARNAHKFPLLPVDLEWRQLGMTPEDMQFSEVGKVTTRRVAEVYHIPAVLLGDTERSTFNNMSEAQVQLWTEGILPSVTDMADQLNARFAWQWGDNVRVVADTSGISALRKDSKAEAEAVQIWVNSGFDPQWSFKRVTGEDAPDEAVAPATQPSDAPSIASEKSLVPRNQDVRKANGAGPEPASAVRGVRRTFDEKDLAEKQFQDLEMLRTHGAPIVREGLLRQMNAVLDALQAVYEHKSLRRLITKARRIPYSPKRPGTFDGPHLPGMDPKVEFAIPEDVAASDIVPGELIPIIWSDATKGAMGSAVEEVSARAAYGALQRYQSLIPISIEIGHAEPSAVEKARAEAADKVVEINKTTEDRLRKGIADALESGDGFTAVRDAVVKAFLGSEPDGLDMYANRDENIAATEMGRAYNTAARRDIAEAGMNAKWICTPKPTSRDTHLHLNGHVVPADGLFHLGKYWVPNPNYDTLPPEETCNCGCTVVATMSAPSAGEENNHRMHGIGSDRASRTGERIESNDALLDAMHQGMADAAELDAALRGSHG